ncbi:MAG TPA: T9SS type A sorting domain-containing protein [candidate division WOR-3 bacterium]|uniref:T9SS type A sorting domain-containing protein n=1 Tax=candidate division WOR-3 bacterium TaxID=2052148 RepID=A0A7C5HE10_UNCW3|nr:T9SS type A sorting domain-containing protein [candidate division WOR-3 bacterium]
MIQSLGGSIIIEFESKRERDIRLRIYDIAGRLHRDKKITLSMGIKRYSIDNLPQGIYFIKVNKRIYKGIVVR